MRASLRKIFFSAVLVISLLPIHSGAFFFIQTFDLTVNVHTASGDASFDFTVRSDTLEPEVLKNLSVQTAGGSGSNSITLDNFFGYKLTESIPEGWSLDSVVCISDNPETTTSPLENGALITAVSGSALACTFNNSPAVQKKTPVLVIPGTLGTEIFKGDKKLWLNLDEIKGPIDDFMDPLAFKEDGTALDTSLVLGDVLQRPVIDFDYARQLISDFTSRGYQLDRDLFLLAYDWRDDIAKNALGVLKEKIDKLAAASPLGKVDVVAHSQGGLLIKRLLYEKPEYRAKVDKLVFVGTPHLGSPKSVKALVYGDNFNISKFGIFGLNPLEMKKIGRNMPAVYEMLPSAEYFNHSSGYVGEYSFQGDFRIGKVHSSYAETQSALKNSIYNLNSGLLDKAGEFHAPDFDNFDFGATGIDAYNLAGCQSATMGKVFINGGGSRSDVVYEPGDGTVPVVSASNVSGAKNFYALKSGEIHGTMLTASGIREKIVNIITGDNRPTPGITSNPGLCVFNGNQVEVHSPVDLHIYDENNHHLGPTDTGEIEFGIDGAQYEVIGQEKYAFLPPGHTYTIKLIATQSGSFTFYSSVIQNNQITSTAFYASVPIGSSSVAQTVLAADNGQALALDSDGDGAADSSITPTARLSGPAATDLLPPQTQVSLSGTTADGQLFSSALAVRFSAADRPADNPAGVLKILYRLDGGDQVICPADQAGAASCQTVVSALGIHKFEYYAADRLGNREAPRQITFTIQNPPSSGSGTGRNYETNPLPVVAPPALAVSSPAAVSSPPPAPPSSLQSNPLPPPALPPAPSSPAPPQPPTGKVLGASTQEPALLPTSHPAQDGQLILDASDNRTIYMIGSGGVKRGFATPQALFKFGYTFAQAQPLDLSRYPAGNPINQTDTLHPNGSLIQQAGQVWWLNFDRLQPFASDQAFAAYGFTRDMVVKAVPEDLLLPQAEALTSVKEHP